jgi:hypothetical protein
MSQKTKLPAVQGMPSPTAIMPPAMAALCPLENIVLSPRVTLPRAIKVTLKCSRNDPPFISQIYTGYMDISTGAKNIFIRIADYPAADFPYGFRNSGTAFDQSVAASGQQGVKYRYLKTYGADLLGYVFTSYTQFLNHCEWELMFKQFMDVNPDIKIDNLRQQLKPAGEPVDTPLGVLPGKAGLGNGSKHTVNGHPFPYRRESGHRGGLLIHAGGRGEGEQPPMLVAAFEKHYKKTADACGLSTILSKRKYVEAGAVTSRANKYVESDPDDDDDVDNDADDLDDVEIEDQQPPAKTKKQHKKVVTFADDEDDADVVEPAATATRTTRSKTATKNKKGKSTDAFAEIDLGPSLDSHNYEPLVSTAVVASSAAAAAPSQTSSGALTLSGLKRILTHKISWKNRSALASVNKPQLAPSAAAAAGSALSGKTLPAALAPSPPLPLHLSQLSSYATAAQLIDASGIDVNTNLSQLQLPLPPMSENVRLLYETRGESRSGTTPASTGLVNSNLHLVNEFGNVFNMDTKYFIVNRNLFEVEDWHKLCFAMQLRDSDGSQAAFLIEGVRRGIEQIAKTGAVPESFKYDANALLSVNDDRRYSADAPNMQRVGQRIVLPSDGRVITEWGVRATKDIPARAIIGNYVGRRIRGNWWELFGEEVAYRVAGIAPHIAEDAYARSFTDERGVDVTVTARGPEWFDRALLAFINTSRDKNKHNCVFADHADSVVTTRAIARGEFLCVSYGPEYFTKMLARNIEIGEPAGADEIDLPLERQLTFDQKISASLLAPSHHPAIEEVDERYSSTSSSTSARLFGHEDVMSADELLSAPVDWAAALEKSADVSFAQPAATTPPPSPYVSKSEEQYETSYFAFE